MNATDAHETLLRGFRDSLDLKQKVLESDLIATAEHVSNTILSAFKAGHKVLFCGNGGSAADAQHLAAEFSGRYYFDRAPLPSDALHANTSYLTAVANDYSFEEIYSRLVRGLGHSGDVLVGLSTSGNSTNVVKALQSAREIGMVTIGFTGEGGGKMKDVCDYLIAIPSKDTPRIQECHMLIGHLICESVERAYFQ